MLTAEWLEAVGKRLEAWEGSKRKAHAVACSDAGDQEAADAIKAMNAAGDDLLAHDGHDLLCGGR